MAGPFECESKPQTIASGPIEIPEEERKLIAWWKLDNTEGSIATDSSGNNNDGTLIGDPAWRPSAGKFNGALLFDGDGDCVKIENESNFDITKQITVSVWVNVSSVPVDWTAIITKGDTSWRLSTDAGDRRFHFGIRETTWINGRDTFSANEWHHLVGVYDGVKMSTYIDGMLDVSRTCYGEISTNDFPVYIGENGQRTGRFWDGLMDDIRIYNYALSKADIKKMFAGTEFAKQE